MLVIFNIPIMLYHLINIEGSFIEHNFKAIQFAIFMRWHCMLHEKVNVLLLKKIKYIILLLVLQACIAMCETYLKQIF